MNVDAEENVVVPPEFVALTLQKYCVLFESPETFMNVDVTPL